MNKNTRRIHKIAQKAFAAGQSSVVVETMKNQNLINRTISIGFVKPPESKRRPAPTTPKPEEAPKAPAKAPTK